MAWKRFVLCAHFFRRATDIVLRDRHLRMVSSACLLQLSAKKSKFFCLRNMNMQLHTQLERMWCSTSLRKESDCPIYCRCKRKENDRMTATIIIPTIPQISQHLEAEKMPPSPSNKTKTKSKPSIQELNVSAQTSSAILQIIECYL